MFSPPHGRPAMPTFVQSQDASPNYQGSAPVHQNVPTVQTAPNYQESTSPYGQPAMPRVKRDIVEDSIDPSPHPGTDGSDEELERSLGRISPEELAAFMQTQIEMQVFKAVAPFMARVRESEQGGILGKANTLQRENGMRQRFDAPQSAVLEKRLVEISGGSGAAPKICTISLSKENLTVPPALSKHLLRARITWGAGKSSNKVIIDFKQGQRITVDGSSITVDGIYTGGGGVFPIVGPSVMLGAQIVEGSLGVPTNSATFTTIRAAVAAAGSLPLEVIPNFAQTVMVKSQLAGPFTIFFETSGEVGVGSPYAAISVLANVPVSIPNGAELASVTNDGEVADNISMVFGLNF